MQNCSTGNNENENLPARREALFVFRYFAQKSMSYLLL